MICRKLTRTIPSVKNQRRSFTIWQCGVLRVVRNFFEYPVLLLFKILGRRHGLLHLWDLSDTHVHETIDRREIQHLVHPAHCVRKGSRHAARYAKTDAHRNTTMRGHAYGKLSSSITNRSSRDSNTMTHTASLNMLFGETKTLADIWTGYQMKIDLTLPHGARGNGTKTTGSLP